MPFVAKLLSLPKFTGGQTWTVGEYYSVKNKTNSISVLISSMDNTISDYALTPKTARTLFSKPEWIQTFDKNTISKLHSRDEKSKLNEDKPKVNWVIP